MSFCERCFEDVADHDQYGHILKHLDRLETLGRAIMTAVTDLQDTLNGYGQQLTDLGNSLSTDAATIEANQAATVDLTALQDGLATLTTGVASIAALANPTPPPAPDQPVDQPV